MSQDQKDQQARIEDSINAVLKSEKESDYKISSKQRMRQYITQQRADEDFRQRENQARRMRRARKNLERADSNVDKILEAVHDASGSTITANSRRLRTLPPGKAREQARDDVAADIARYVDVPLEVQADCVRSYAQAAAIQMKVCGSCGLRDPKAKYLEFDLTTLKSTHPLVVGSEAYQRLCSTDPIPLLRRKTGGDGVYEEIDVARVVLYNFAHVNGKVLHVIPETMRGGKIDMCSFCHSGFPETKCGERRKLVLSGDGGSTATRDTFDDLYVSNAPLCSIASGADFGRLRGLSEMGITTDVSTLEQLVLAEARCHHVVFKVVAYGEDTSRLRLHGHSIVCPQKPEDCEKFGEAALAAAFESVRIVFVGPSGEKGKLERAALKIDDLRLRPDVIYNFLTIKYMLHGGEPPPSMDEVQSLIAKHGGLKKHLDKNARWVTDVSVERAAEASDVANVRRAAESSTKDSDMQDVEAEEAAAAGEAISPNLSAVCLLKPPDQGMNAAIAGIAKAVEDETDKGDFPMDGVADHQGDSDGTGPCTGKETRKGVTGGNVLLKRTGPMDDYDNAAASIYAAWWPLLLLKRGFIAGKPVTDHCWRHLFLYYDNRFAHNMPLLFHVANIKIRHAVNRAVGVQVQSSGEAFEKFKDLISDESFRQLLEKAKQNPEGPEGKIVLSRVVSFINLAAGGVPWSSRERAKEMTKLLAMHRYAGPASIFYTVAPDNVHNVTTIQWSFPFTSYHSFPAVVSHEWLAALQGQEPRQRMVLRDDGTVAHRLDESSLQRLAGQNPVAEAITFDLLFSNVRENLLRNAPTRLANKSVASDRLKGVLGLNVTNHDVKETNKRGYFHNHGHAIGGATPSLVAHIAADARLRKQVLDALDTQVQATLPLEYHAVTLLQKALKIGARRDASFTIPMPPPAPEKNATEETRWEYERELQEWWPRFRHHALMVVAGRHVHKHCPTCLTGKRGKTGCRLCAPWAHDLNETRIVELRMTSKNTDDGSDGKLIGCRCCYAGGALDDMLDLDEASRTELLANEAIQRDIHYKLHEPSELPDTEVDGRALALELKRPLLPEPRGTLQQDEEFDGSALAALVRNARDRRRRNWTSPVAARECLRELIAQDQPLGRLLQVPELELLRNKLLGMTAEPMEVDQPMDGEEAHKKKTEEHTPHSVLGVLEALSDPHTGCRQGIVADYNIVFAGCTRGNAMIATLGAGSGSKGSALYQAKYMSKECTEIVASSSVLIDAYNHIRQYESKAEDSGTEERDAKRYAQRVINSAAMELEAAQAAGIVLGMNSSGGSDAIEFYSGWDHQKLAEIVSSGTYDDIDFSHAVETPEVPDESELVEISSGHVTDGNDDTGGQQQPVAGEEKTEPVAQSPLNNLDNLDIDQPDVDTDTIDLGQKKKTIDLLEDVLPQAYGLKSGYAAIYQTADGTKVAVSAAHHYAYRDEKLNRFSSFEFARGFKIRKMTKADKEWYEKEMSDQSQGDRRPGRPCDRFRLVAPHPLAQSHILVHRKKMGIPAWAGKPPPKLPPTPLEDNSPAAQRRRGHVIKFYVANFIPWSVAEAQKNGSLDLSYERWHQYIEGCKDDACLYSAREPNVGAASTDEDCQLIDHLRRERMIACGRLQDIEHLTTGFKTNKEMVLMLSKHRERARTLWNDCNRPGGETRGPDEAMREAAKKIDRLREKAHQLMSGKTVTTRQNEASWATEWGKSLAEALPSKLECSASAAEGQKLCAVWGTAAAPQKRSLAPHPHDIKAVCEALKKPLSERPPPAPRAPTPSGTSEGAATVWRNDDPFDEITDDEYDAAVRAHREAGAPMKEAPLNPEQRRGGRDFLRVAEERARGLAREASLESIDRDINKKSLAQVTLVVGAGGTGKSAMVHALKREFERLRLGVLLVTAYTGVAAAPFGGPTLLSLLGLGVQAKAARNVRSISNEGQREARRAKFEAECGYPIEQIGGIVIDEVSFIEVGVFGHVDADLRNLFGSVADHVLCGGIPLLLCGDCHQKPPPGGVQWYKIMTEVALGTVENPLAGGSMSAKSRGLQLLQKAKRIELTRLMRAQGDRTFIEYMKAMRRTHVTHPIPQAFLDKLEPVSAKDVQQDGAWRFAPIGVLSHVERDAINHAQLHAFARHFDIPLVRWRLELVDDAFADPQVREQLFEHEPNLWGYFVEGAPVHLLETIKSVRKLVNGTPGLLDSLVVNNDKDKHLLRSKFAGGHDVLTLEEPPYAVNIIVGGTKTAPRLWHEVPLEDLSDYLPGYYDGDEQMVPLLMSAAVEKAELTSMFGAQQGITDEVRVKQHQYGLAFALTDFKLQGRTLEKLILSVCKRSKMPHMTLCSFYVLVSRVREMNGLRLLQKDEEGLTAVSKREPDPFLYAWENGYLKGRWEGERAAQAWHEINDKRKEEKKAKRNERATFRNKNTRHQKQQKPLTTTIIQQKANKEEVKEEKEQSHTDGCKEPTRRQGSGLRGLTNRANVCYMNCVMQCLSNINPADLDYNGSPKFPWPTPDRAQGEVASAFRAMMSALQDDAQLGPIDTMAMKNVLREPIVMCRDNEHHDAMGFCIELLACLHNDLMQAMGVDLSRTGHANR